MSDDIANTETATQARSILLDAVLYYIGGTIILGVASYFLLPAGTGIFLLLYLAIGFVLNRKVLRRLGFHPMYDTLYNVSRSKLWAFLLWPLVYLMLIFRLLVNKVL